MIDVDIEQQLGAFALAVRFAVDAPIVGLFGASGAGKTSVVNAIAGIGKPGRGSISVNGTLLFDSAQRINLPPDKRRVGYVFQDALLFPHLDVQRNLLYGQRLCPPTDRFIDPARIVALLGLDGLLRRGTVTLSGGERQRVAIGRALLAQPRILLMDEPLVALDAPRRDEVLDYIERLRDDLRIPMVYVSHSRSEIARLADAVVVLTSVVTNTNKKPIVELAARNRLPAIYYTAEWTQNGGLLSYGANFDDLFRRAATYVDKILKGAKPADLPVEQARKFELTVNLKAAKQIGLSIPVNVLARANRVIR